LKYDGITVESGECEIVSFSVGEFTREAWKKQLGIEPIDWEEARR
jgi:hypothetical protein